MEITPILAEYEHFRKYCVNIVRQILGNDNIFVDDVLTDGLLRANSLYHRFDSSKSSLNTFVAMVVKTHALNFKRIHNNNPNLRAELLDTDAITNASDNDSVLPDADEVLDLILSLPRANKTASHKELFHRVFVLGEYIDEVASDIGMNYATARTTIGRAYDDVRNHYSIQKSKSTHSTKRVNSRYKVADHIFFANGRYKVQIHCPVKSITISYGVYRTFEEAVVARDTKTHIAKEKRSRKIK